MNDKEAQMKPEKVELLLDMRCCGRFGLQFWVEVHSACRATEDRFGKDRVRQGAETNQGQEY